MKELECVVNRFHEMEIKLKRYEELVGKLEDIEIGNFEYLFDKFKTKKGYNSSTGVRGIKVEKLHKSRRWKAQMKIDYKNISLGYFDNMLDALNCRLQEEYKILKNTNEGELKNV